jgi:hypothetical protein
VPSEIVPPEPGIGVFVGVRVGVDVLVAVFVGAGVFVPVGVFVDVDVLVGVLVGVPVFVGVLVGDGVLVGVLVAETPTGQSAFVPVPTRIAMRVVFTTLVCRVELAESMVYVSRARLGAVTRLTARQPSPETLNVNTASWPAATIEGGVLSRLVHPQTRCPADGVPVAQNTDPGSAVPLTCPMLLSVRPALVLVAMCVL